jgi:Rho termination factor, N-terminal domain
MATPRQLDAARANIKKAQAAARRRRLPGTAGERVRLHVPSVPALEDRNPQQLYALAQTHHIRGRAAMGKGELIAAIRRVG